MDDQYMANIYAARHKPFRKIDTDTAAMPSPHPDGTVSKAVKMKFMSPGGVEITATQLHVYPDGTEWLTRGSSPGKWILRRIPASDPQPVPTVERPSAAKLNGNASLSAKAVKPIKRASATLNGSASLTAKPKVKAAPKRPQRHWDNHDWLYAEYVTKRRSMLNIGKEVGCAEQTVAKALKRHGIKTRPTKRKPLNAVASKALQDHDWLRAEYLTKDRAINDIARELGCKSQTVKRALIAAGCDIRSLSESLMGMRNPVTKLTDDDVREVRKRRAAGELCKTIANEYGVSPTMVSKIGTGEARADVE